LDSTTASALRRLVGLGLLCALGCAAVGQYRFAGKTEDRPALAALHGQPVAVLPFSGPDGAHFADTLTAALGRAQKFAVIARDRVGELYRVQGLDANRVDQAAAVHLGRMLQASAVLMGAVSDYRAGRISADVRLVAVETGSVIWQGSDALDATSSRVQSLVEGRDARNRLRTSPDYLCQWFCRLLVESMK
jgi:TolB-like protein